MEEDEEGREGGGCGGSVDVYMMHFFLRGEDGIRDAEEYRGLGDVYKRKVRNLKILRPPPHLAG